MTIKTTSNESTEIRTLSNEEIGHVSGGFIFCPWPRFPGIPGFPFPNPFGGVARAAQGAASAVVGAVSGAAQAVGKFLSSIF